jgi:hypothetical protein
MEPEHRMQARMSLERVTEERRIEPREMGEQ